MGFNEQQQKKDQPTAKSLVTGSIRLVSLPEVCLRVNEMLDDPDTSASDFGQVISQDTGLTARLLKIVNSSFYGFSSRVETVSRAVAIIGLRELRGLVIAASAVEIFSRIPTEVLNMVRFWRHSVYCGVVARLLAERCHVLHSERLFVAGLLHDIGKLIICNRLPDQARLLQDKINAREGLDFEIEQDMLGFDHAEVGGELLSSWLMPQSLINAVRYHHFPGDAGEFEIEVAIVHIANAMTGMAEQGLDVDVEMLIQPVDEKAWETLGLDESVMPQLFADAGTKFGEALDLVLPQNIPGG